jgi:hypothetical protein
MRPILILTILLVSSCVHLNPRIKVDSDFSGIESQEFQKGKFDNTQSIDSKYFLIIHGIGPQDSNYSYELMKSIAKYSKINFSVNRKKLNTGSTFTRLEKTEYFNVLHDKRLVFYSIKWSDLVEPSRQEIRFREDELSGRFHGFTRTLKRQLMYKRVADAFLGQDSTHLAKIIETMEVAFGDITDETGGLEKLSQLNLISGSFGSQLFIRFLYDRQEDLLQPLTNQLITEDYSKWSKFFGLNLNEFTEKLEDKVFYDSVYAHVLSVSKDSLLTVNNFNTKGLQLNFYMLTNQLNLMDGNIPNWGGNMPTDSSRLRIKSVRAVAFRNTNDLLCYYVPEEVFSKYFRCNDVQVTNTYYWNFLIRNNALSAHTAVFKLNKLAKAIVKGSDGTFWVKEIKTRRK